MIACSSKPAHKVKSQAETFINVIDQGVGIGMGSRKRRDQGDKVAQGQGHSATLEHRNG